MKTIVLIAVSAIILLELSGAVPNSSVGGPLTRALVFFAAVLAVGLYEAWSKKRGVLGWIVNIIVAVAGGFVAAEIGNVIFELLILSGLRFEGTLADQGGPLLYFMLAAMMLVMLLGAWTALQIANRWR